MTPAPQPKKRSWFDTWGAPLTLGGVLLGLHGISRLGTRYANKAWKAADPAARAAKAAEEAQRVRVQKAHEFFGFQPGVEPAEIKKVYKTRAREVHPDFAGGADPTRTEAFKDLGQHYDVLKQHYKFASFEMMTFLDALERSM